MRLIHIWRSAFIRVNVSFKCNVRNQPSFCDETPSYVWHDSFISVTWLFHMYRWNQLSFYAVTHLYITWLFYVRVMTHFTYTGQESSERVWCDSSIHGVNPSYKWHNWIYVSARNQLKLCDVIYSHMTWLIHAYWWGFSAVIFEIPACTHMYDTNMTHWICGCTRIVTHSYRRRIVANILEIFNCKSSMKYYSSICGTWLMRIYDIRMAWRIRMCDVTHSYILVKNRGKDPWDYLLLFILGMWFIHVWDMTHAYVCCTHGMTLRICDMTHSYTLAKNRGQDPWDSLLLFIHGMWFIHMWNMTHSCLWRTHGITHWNVWNDSFIYTGEESVERSLRFQHAYMRGHVL